MTDLKLISKEINNVLEKKRNELQLTFEEEGHIYTMLDSKGILRSDFKSVSTIEKMFYEEFDSEGKALSMCNGDVEKQKKLLAEWAFAGSYATNKGSRVHYELEKYIISKNNIKKDIRMPIFECDEQQMLDSDKMIKAGKQFLDLMEKRGCVLIDTEVVLGSQKLNYVGQADNFWVSYNKDKSQYGIIITDHKTNKVENMSPKPYHGFMYPPFHKYRNFAVSHYYLQLSLYWKLFKDMMKNSEFENIKLLGCVLDSLRDDGTFMEYRVPMEIVSIIEKMDLKKYKKI